MKIGSLHLKIIFSFPVLFSYFAYSQNLLDHNSHLYGTLKNELGYKNTRIYNISSDPPVVITNPATSITSTTVILNGSVNSSGLSTTTWFEWGTANDLSSYSSTNTQSINPVAGSLNISANLTGLTPGTTYYFRVAAQNSSGTQKGKILSFTTLQPPQIAINVKSLSFVATQNGSLPQSKTFNISNRGGGMLNWAISDDATWLDLNPTSGTDTGIVTANINTTNLSPKTFTATITITAQGASNSPQTLGVTYIVNQQQQPSISVNPTSLDFGNVALNNNNDKSVTILNNGTSTLIISSLFLVGFDASMFSVFSGGTTPINISPGNSSVLTIRFTPTGAGTRSATLQIIHNASGGSTSVSLSGTGIKLPSIILNPTSLTFNASQYGTLPSNRNLNINFDNDGTFNWTAGDDAAWLDIYPTGGTGSDTITVSVNTTNLIALNSTAKITITATGVSNSPQVVNVIYTLTPYPTSINLSNTINFPTYTNAKDYRVTDWKIVGLPGASNLDVTSIFTGKQGTDWEAYWDNGSVDYIKYDGSSNFKFSIGRAFWIINKGTLNIDTTITSAPLNSSIQAEIPLHSGWNLITNPFTTSISWSKIQGINGNIQSPIYAYNNGYSNPTSFEPYVGYFFENRNNLTTLKIPYTPVAIEKLECENYLKWKVNINYVNGKYSDNITSFGVSERSKQGMDDLDFRKPRAIGEISEIYFNRPEWDKKLYKFATDIRPEFKDSEVWEFEVNSIYMEPAQLRFYDIDKIPAHYEIYLFDKCISRNQNLRMDSIYRFKPTSKITKFSVFVGKAEIIEQKIKLEIPKDFELGENYPNPFNLSTKIQIKIPYSTEIKLLIYNPLGEEIRTLYSGILSIGTHTFEWNGKDNAGNYVSSGIYIYRLHANSGINLSKKMIFMK